MEPKVIDRGRGPELSTKRITVQDVYPYVQRNATPEEMLEAISALSAMELQVLLAYINEHRAEVEEEDRRLRQRNAGQKNPSEVEEILRQARMRRRARQQLEQGKNSANHHG